MKRLVSMLLVVAVLLPAVPAFAAEEVAALPEIKQPSSARLDGIILVNNMPVQWGKGVVAGDRLHLAVVNPTPATTGVAEVVVIGQRVYVRFNQETRWKATTVDAAEFPTNAPTIAEQPLNYATIFRVGEATVNGAPTIQYQARIDVAAVPDSEGLEAAKADAFIGTSDAYLHKYQFMISGILDPEMGRAVLDGVFVYSAFNASVTIGAPPQNLVDQMAAREIARLFQFPGAEVVPLWVRPLVRPQQAKP